MDGVTINQLLQACKQEVKKGNGDKVVQISTDDEGNGYHTLFYGFCSNEEDIEKCIEMGMFHDDVDPRNTILLG